MSIGISDLVNFIVSQLEVMTVSFLAARRLAARADQRYAPPGASERDSRGAAVPRPRKRNRDITDEGRTYFETSPTRGLLLLFSA